MFKVTETCNSVELHQQLDKSCHNEKTCFKNINKLRDSNDMQFGQIKNI